MLSDLHLDFVSCLFETLRTITCQALLSMGFSMQTYYSGLPFSSPEDFPKPRNQPESLKSPALAGEFFTTSAFHPKKRRNDTKKSCYCSKHLQKKNPNGQCGHLDQLLSNQQEGSRKDLTAAGKGKGGIN